MNLRRFLAAAAALGAFWAAGDAASAATWGAPTTVTAASADAPRFAVGADGTAAISYVARGVWVAVRRPHAPWGRPVRVSTGRFNVSHPSVAVDGKGGVIVAWTQDSDVRGQRSDPATTRWRGPLTIRVRIRARSGAWGSVRTLGTTGHFRANGPEAAAAASGDGIVVWGGVRQAGGHGLDPVRSAFRPATQPFGAAQRIPERGTRSGAALVALSAEGTAFATWTGRTGVQIAARGRGRTGAWGSARTIGPGLASNPVLGVTPDRSVIVAWHRAPSDTEGQGAQYGPLMTATRLPTGALTVPQQVSALQTRDYALAVAPSGEAMLASVAQAGVAQPVLRYSTRAASGGVFGPEQDVPGVEPAVAAGTPGALGYLADGTAVYVWIDGQNGDAVRAVARPRGRTFGAVEDVVPAWTGNSFPAVGAVGDTATAVWTHSTVGLSETSVASADRR